LIVFLRKEVIGDLLYIIIVSHCPFYFFIDRLRLSILVLFAPNSDVRFKIKVSEALILLAIENLSDLKG